MIITRRQKEILKIIKASRKKLTLREIAKRDGTSKQNIHQILLVLLRNGVIKTDEFKSKIIWKNLKINK